MTRTPYTTAIPKLLAEHATQLEEIFVPAYFNDRIVKEIISEGFCHLNSLALHLLPPNFKMADIKSMIQLKTLSLHMKIEPLRRINVSLNSIANNLPKGITSLTLFHSVIIVDKVSNQQGANITHLKVEQSVVDDISTSSFLIKHFKKLQSLVLSTCSIAYTMHLPHHHLGYAELRPAPPLGIFSGRIHLQLTISSKTQYFGCNVQDNLIDSIEHKGHRPLEKVLKGSEKDDTMDYFHFTCGSLEAAYYRSYYLLL